MITLPSSAQIIQFPAAPVQWEAWKEAWLRQVHADSELISRDKNVSTAISWYLNRDSRDCFPKYSTIAKDICIKDRLDVRDSIKRLASRRHLEKRPRGKGKSNLLAPRVWGYNPTGVGTGPHTGVGTGPHHNLLIKPPTEPVEANNDSFRKNGAGNTGASKKKNAPALAFEGQTVRVTPEQLARWRNAYPLIDVTAMLQVCDDHYSQRPPADGKWFWRVSRWLQKENDERSKAKSEAEDLSF